MTKINTYKISVFCFTHENTHHNMYLANWSNKIDPCVVLIASSDKIYFSLLIEEF